MANREVGPVEESEKACRVAFLQVEYLEAGLMKSPVEQAEAELQV